MENLNLSSKSIKYLTDVVKNKDKKPLSKKEMVEEIFAYSNSYVASYFAKSNVNPGQLFGTLSCIDDFITEHLFEDLEDLSSCTKNTFDVLDMSMITIMIMSKKILEFIVALDNVEDPYKLDNINVSDQDINFLNNIRHFMGDSIYSKFVERNKQCQKNNNSGIDDLNNVIDILSRLTGMDLDDIFEKKDKKDKAAPVVDIKSKQPLAESEVCADNNTETVVDIKSLKELIKTNRITNEYIASMIVNGSISAYDIRDSVDNDKLADILDLVARQKR